MEHINKQAIEQLSKERSENSISIYLPTYREDPESREERNRINLKNKIKTARQELKDQGYQDKQIESYLKPLYDIVEDAGFLRNLWNALAIFLNERTFEYYTLPLNFDNVLYMGNDFYLLPLLRPVRENKSFYILSLNLHGVKLYKADRFSIEEQEVEPFVPGKVEEVSGFVNKKESIWGTVNNDSFDVARHQERQAGDEDLLNFAAIQAFLNNGNVYLMEPEEMPDQNKPLNALYRF